MANSITRILKGCPACHGKPTITDSKHIICNAHPSFKVSVHGETLEESIQGWNDDDDWQMLGSEPVMVLSRPNYNIELG